MPWKQGDMGEWGPHATLYANSDDKRPVAMVWPSSSTPGVWCGSIGGGVILADSEEEAKQALEAKLVALRVTQERTPRAVPLQ